MNSSILNNKWQPIIDEIDFDLQPIVNIKSGQTYGVEMFLRNHQKAGGFYSIANFFDEAYNDGVLYQVDLSLREKALKKFKTLHIKNLRMFYNLDYRIMDMPDFTAGNTKKLSESLEIDKKTIFFEISEKSSLKDPRYVRNLSSRYKQEGYNVAIDNFASGISGIQLLYYPNSDFIKIDRMFINNINKDSKKRLFLNSIISMAHIMNIKVIATCIENVDEYYVCKDLGVDFIQGNFIQESTGFTKNILDSYGEIKELYKSDKRDKSSNKIDKDKIDRIKSLKINSTLEELFLYFKQNTDSHFAPIVDDFDHLLGAVFEKDIKKMSYSQYGMSLAKNTNMELTLETFMKHIVSAEITWSVDKILDIYNSTTFDKSGIFITKNNQYYGFVNVNNLLEISYYRNVEIARDQNPLTKLPGNGQIEAFIDKAFNTQDKTYHVIYFDFNDFKPFNDFYGFRQGDRAILMFADILKKALTKENIFLGHIGGDDFFVGFEGFSYQETHTLIKEVQRSFQLQVTSLYNQKDRENGYIKTKDRFGNIRKFPLLGVATSIVEINHKLTKECFDNLLHNIKKASKNSKEPLGFSILY